MIHNLRLELVVLPNVLALALHQVNYFGWMDQGDHSWCQTILLVRGDGVGLVAHVIIVSAQVPLVLTLGLWTLGLQTWA